MIKQKYKNRRYGKLVIIQEPKGRFVKVKCDCGVICIKGFYNLGRFTNSCGCIQKTAGGESKTNPLFVVYHGAKRRCEETNNKDYKRYGGRGIRFQWDNFIKFKEDMEKSYLKHIKKYGRENTSIDRIDVNGDYCKENCRWVTRSEQSLNTRRSKFLTINGVTKNYSIWAKQIGCSRQALRYRVINGLDPNLILTLPFKYSNKYAKPSSSSSKIR